MKVLLELARGKNIAALPLIKSHCGLRLPPDRHCLVAPNYKLRAAEVQPKKLTKTALDRAHAKAAKTPGTAIKRQSIAAIPKSQTVTIPKPVFKFAKGTASAATTTTSAVKTQPVAKTQLIVPPTPPSSIKQDIKMEIDGDYMSSSGGSVKRKREDDDFEAVE